MVEILPLPGIGEVVPGDDVSALLGQALARMGFEPRKNDVVVVTSKILSKADDRFVRVSSVVPSDEAVRLAELTSKDARLVELVLRESTEILRKAPNLLIARHRLGLVMANAGIDASNVGDPDRVLLLPRDPDDSARRIRNALSDMGYDLAVVISDSCGRPWRLGVVNMAIGAAGLPALVDRRGDRDRQGRELAVTQVALGDLLASAAGLVSGEGAEGLPAVLIRGYDLPEGDVDAASLVRPLDQDLFR